MNTPPINHNLIEYILSLLIKPENLNVDLDTLMEKSKQELSASPSESQNIQMAWDVINFMDEMPGGFLIYHADQEEKIIYANKGILRIFRCDTLKEFQELTGNSFRGVVHPEDLEPVEKSIREQVAASQYDLDYVEYRIIRKDGEIGWIEDYGHFLHLDSVGDIFYVFLGDATEKRARLRQETELLLQERTQKEQKLQKLIKEYNKERKLINQEHLRRLEVIEGLSVNYESILYVDLDTDRILPYRLSNRTEHQFDKKFQIRQFSWYAPNYIETWVHPEDQELVAKVTAPSYIRKKLSTCKTYYANYRVLNCGELQYLQLRIVNVGRQDRISQIVMGYRIVDEEVRREMEQKKMFEDALNNANIAITAKNTFLSNMSHDMRTPLNAIFGYTTLAKKHISDSKAVEDYLTKIENSSKQLLGLIEKVLEISWTESSDTRISESECNLSDILQDVYETLLPQAEEKNIAFSLDSTDLDHCDVYGDQDKLRQILANLAGNAITYTENDGNVSITLKEIEKFPNNFAVYQLVVKDTGIGISKDFQKRIFEPFEREKNTTFSGIHGTGLGLTIAKRLVDMMGGTIQIDSTLGGGSTFTITIRLRIQTHPLSSITEAEDMFTHLLDKKILLVDDNFANLEIETEILQGMGFLVETANNGKVAVEKVESSSPGDYDLVLMDIQMPVMNGWEAAKSIRSLENSVLARIPIIALSADAFDSDKQTSIESGMDAHLTKPIDIPLILETIAKTLQTHKVLYEDPS
ncbi:MAG: response regulator [Lachnospiraceae bacterium]|nr:response regulator [Lachnospiraceae bacterium]